MIGLLIGYSFQSLHRVHERAQDQGDAQRDEERDACRWGRLEQARGRRLEHWR